MSNDYLFRNVENQNNVHKSQNAMKWYELEWTISYVFMIQIQQLELSFIWILKGIITLGLLRRDKMKIKAFFKYRKITITVSSLVPTIILQ